MAKKTDQERREAWNKTREKGVRKYQERQQILKSVNKDARKKNAERDKIIKAAHKKAPVLKPKKRKPIAKKSATQKKRDKKYFPAKKAFLKLPENEMCNMRISPECIENRMPSCDLHHMKGKCGDLYWDTRYFLATCRYCHNYELANDAEAKAKGVSVLRLTRIK